MKALELFVRQMNDVVFLNGHIDCGTADRIDLTFDRVSVANEEVEHDIVYELTCMDSYLGDGVYSGVQKCAENILNIIKRNGLI